MELSAVLSLALIHVCVVSAARSVENLPPYDNIVELTDLYKDSLRVQESEDRFFPSIRFTHNGSIIGWRFPAAPGNGRVEPVLSILRLISGTTYNRTQRIPISTCTVRMYQLSNGVNVELHESGPLEPVPFKEGDILGLHLRNSNAHFVPYLYDSALEGGQTLVSYILARQAIRNNEVTLDNLPTDTRQPLFGLATCNSSVENVNDSMYCNGKTLFNNSTCIELSPSDSPPSSEFLVTVITVPILGVLLLLVVGMVLVVCLCICSVRASKKRQHSMYNEEVAMDELNGTISTFDDLGDAHDYDVVNVKETTLREVDNSMYKPGTTSPGSYRDGNGAVANYEEPVLSQSQESFVHLYDKTHGIVFAAGTPPPPFNHTPSPQSFHSHLPPTPSPQFHRPHFPPTSSQQSGYYHSLERSLQDRPQGSLSSLVIQTVASEGSTPNGSPPRSQHSSTLPVDRRLSVSPKPRHRLKSTPNTKVTACILGDPNQSHDPLRPQSEQGYASLRENGHSFNFETGVYVPTKKQINELSSSPRDSLFDDKGDNSPCVNNWTFFEEIDKYWRPASNTASLYQQLASRKYREVIRKQIQVVSHLGSGEFGTVCKGVWSTEQGEMEVAVKMLTARSNEEATVRFLQEAAIMGQFRHPNLVRLHGVVTVGEPVMIVLELVNNGDLRKYLKSLRSSQPVSDTLPQQLLSFSSQVALGMEYLARKEFVHRDIAARNILLTDDFVCKIADFGLSRDLEDEEYYVSNGGKIPVKWTAPEAIHYRRYSPASDVWSFGVLLYEIWSLGASPFKNKSAEETVALVDSGYRLSPPPGCPKAIYQLMIECWHPDAQDRLSFTELVTSLSQSGDTLLRWSQEDLSSHPQVCVLGSQLSHGEQLYPELQNMYSS
ncbi:uncharacterized protein LOC135341873 isoform X2 [Halichondria panicea]|uniref:uncharacterized protein LOC135341873 isoform X2 n=1 Tax=Halichondria panicea TaxID=6063 RepID=UPI00312BC250